MDNFIVPWLLSNIVDDNNGTVYTKDLYACYEQDCKSNEVPCRTIHVFCKLLMQLFPMSKPTRIRINKAQIRAYTGISYHALQVKLETGIVDLSNIQNYLDHSSMLISKTESCAVIYMMTNITSNGNQVLKEITFNFCTNSWELKVRGHPINMNTLGVSNYFDKTVSNFKNVLHIVNQVKLCTGLQIVHKKLIPVNIISEIIGTACNTKTSTLRKMRCSACKDVLSWFSTGDACRRCVKSLCDFKKSN